jgi:glycerophosphoryl diester phosphodiesterase
MGGVVRPLVIAHRGASGERPEHTRAAYDLAIDQGCDFIEPDLVMSRDGHLVVRHETLISETTDVAARPKFADRKTEKTIDGETVEGWFAEDFTLAELKSLRARERLPHLRRGSAAYDGREPILTFDEVIAIARAGSERTGRTIGVYPELKHPSHLMAEGLDAEAALVRVLKREAWTGADAPVFVQCFEVGTLERLAGRIETPRIQLIAADAGPADRPDLTPAAMTTPDGLAAIAAYATGIGVDKALAIPRRPDGSLGTPSPLVADVHKAGLAVHAWTFRAENHFLPTDLRRGEQAAAHGDLAAELQAFYAAGVDAVFSDFPAVAVAARAAKA